MPDLRSKYYAFAIDVSGTPYTKVCFGLIAYNRNNFYKLKKDVNKKFPRLLSKKQKASKFKSREINKIIQFFDSIDIQMASTYISNSTWKEYRDRYINRANLKEKMYALADLSLLNKYVFPQYNYKVTICNENYLKIESVLDNLRRISKSNRFDFDISTGLAKYNSELKIADYVAGALRKLKVSNLDKFKNYQVINFKPSNRDLNQAFR